MRLWLLSSVMTLAVPGAIWAQNSDDALSRCRSIGLEGFVQDLVGRDIGVTGTILAFCDDYRKLFERAQSNEVALRGANETLELVEQAVEVLTSQMSALQDEIKSLRDRLPPENAIIIVDDSDGCPTGWIDVAAREPQIFAGRTIVARGFYSEREPRDYRDTGGDEAHELTLQEMPEHSHRLNDPGHSHAITPHATTNVGTGDRGFGGVRGSISDQASERASAKITMQESGGGQPHNNMPPFVALYFCKKE